MTDLHRSAPSASCALADDAQRLQVLRALSSAVRLRIFEALGHGGRCVGELVALSDSSQPSVSSHLAVLRRAGLVARRRQGTSVSYRQANGRRAAFGRTLCATFIDGPLARRPAGAEASQQA